MEVTGEDGVYVFVFTYFGGSWSFALMTVPEREKKILLSHYIPSLCSLLQVAFIFSVTSYSPPWHKDPLYVGVCRVSLFFLLFLSSVFLTSMPWAVPRISCGQARIRPIVDCIFLSLYLGMCLALSLLCKGEVTDFELTCSDVWFYTRIYIRSLLIVSCNFSAHVLNLKCLFLLNGASSHFMHLQPFHHQFFWCFSVNSDVLSVIFLLLPNHRFRHNSHCPWQPWTNEQFHKMRINCNIILYFHIQKYILR